MNYKDILNYILYSIEWVQMNTFYQNPKEYNFFLSLMVNHDLCKKKQILLLSEDIWNCNGFELNTILALKTQQIKNKLNFFRVGDESNKQDNSKKQNGEARNKPNDVECKLHL